MLPLSNDMAMGAGAITLCLMLWVRQRWFLEQTRKGQKLVEMVGSKNAPWVLTLILVAGIAFGGLLAKGVIKPIQW